MANCRCWRECEECHLDRIGYSGCKCPGCNPHMRDMCTASHPNSNQSPIEAARTLGILNGRIRYCYRDARKVTCGTLHMQYTEELA